jgi:hypothetical protein
MAAVGQTQPEGRTSSHFRMKLFVSHVGTGLLVGIAFLGMWIGSLLIGACIVAILTFILYEVIGVARGGTGALAAPIISALVLLAVAVSESGTAAASTWYTFAVIAAMAGCAGTLFKGGRRQ